MTSEVFRVTARRYLCGASGLMVSCGPAPPSGRPSSSCPFVGAEPRSSIFGQNCKWVSRSACRAKSAAAVMDGQCGAERPGWWEEEEGGGGGVQVMQAKSFCPELAAPHDYVSKIKKPLPLHPHLTSL